MNKNNKVTMLDGSPEEQKRIEEEFLSSITEQEHAEAMSEKFSYLDDAENEDEAD